MENGTRVVNDLMQINSALARMTKSKRFYDSMKGGIIRPNLSQICRGYRIVVKMINT